MTISYDKNLIFKSNINSLEYNIVVKAEFQSIISPIFNNFPFNHFTYWKLFQNGQYLVLSSNQSIIKAYLEHNSSNNKVFFQEFKAIGKNLSYKALWALNKIDKFAGLSICHKFNTWHGMSVTYNLGNCIESFIFAAPIHCGEVIDLYLNHFYILERFIAHFKNKGQHIINNKDKNIFAFSPFYQLMMNQENLNNGLIVSKKSEFLKSTDINSLKLNSHPDVYLSKAELKCLYQLLLGKSAKEIASTLQSSHRTIEKHLENVKAKCNVNYASQLIEIGKKNGIDKLYLVES